MLKASKLLMLRPQNYILQHLLSEAVLSHVKSVKTVDVRASGQLFLTPP